MKSFIEKYFTIIVFIILLLTFFKGCSDTRTLQKIKNNVEQKIIVNTEIVDITTQLLKVDSQISKINGWLITVNDYQDINEKERLIGELNLLKSQLETLKTRLENLQKENKLLLQKLKDEKLDK